MRKILNGVTTVVNIKRHKCDVYIGRGSPFGNPFRIGDDGDRAQVLVKYRNYFNQRLTDQSFRDKVLELKGKVLGCWCKPLACHGDVIIEYLENTNETETTSHSDIADFLLPDSTSIDNPSA